ncbi:MAG: hypothetical protein C7B45_02810 [Sulfobacillus acidophilus]|uniref:Uncharacterized protein n=1 Tax=Sulfobacillus acidophilus TaxID=53633 RepID=A0A2T2WMM4_9FIRM|nr:MAG: hypothetical protein C7B45_02810 [Sulfobacillus acidophilus]
MVLLSNDQVSVDTGLYIACMITSHAPRDLWNVELLAWKEAGLLFPSVVRCPKVFGLDHILILRCLGPLPTSDWTRVQSRFRAALA